MKIKFLKLKKFFLNFCFISLWFSSNLSTLVAATRETSLDQSKEELFSAKAEDLPKNDFYIIGPGDILNIRFISLPQNISGMNSEEVFKSGAILNVLNDGTISVPYAGIVKITGMTLFQAKENIEQILRKELLSPLIEISILKPRPINVSVIGEVDRPGMYQLNNLLKSNSIDFDPDANLEIPTVINAIQAAGGITNDADLQGVIIKRKLPGRQNNYKKAKLNFIDLIFEGDQSQNLYLFDGDIIILEKVKNYIDKDRTEILSANLAPKTIDITVTGEVVKPGTISVKSGTPLIQGIYKAGGPTNWRANQGNAHLLRSNGDGSVSFKSFRINTKSKKAGDNNPRLKNGDIIKLGRSNLAKTSDAIGAISNPVGSVLTIWSMFKLIQD